jgi:trehalose 6-phosphate synthase/phosphatase
MDSFSEPYTREGDDISLDQVRDNIRALEQQHKKNGIALSGRIIHVCHYLPLVATLNSRPTSSILSPPPTPPTKPLDPDAAAAASEPAASSPWSFAARYGHAAMISGIRSLSSSHEQIVIGWTGDIAPPPSSASASTSSVVTAGADKVPADGISQADKAAFQDALDAYKIDPEDDRGEKRAKYLPVWLDDKVAHGHYDGYCKQSEIRSLPSLSLFITDSEFLVHSPVAAVPLPTLARRRYGIRFRRLSLPVLRICQRGFCTPHCGGVSARRYCLGA